MRVSIITVCYNAELFIERCIRSVLSQDYVPIEYIIIDGGSIDGTLAVVHSFSGSICKIISEPDYGIYHAMNKGIDISTGDIVGFLNSDDEYSDRFVISTIVSAMSSSCLDVCYGDIAYIERSRNVNQIGSWAPGIVSSSSVFFGRIPPHPAFFAKRELIKSVGMFNPAFRIASDYDLMLKCLLRQSFKACYLPVCLVLMRDGGVSRKSFPNILKGNLEVCRSAYQNLSWWAPLTLFAGRLILRVKYILSRD